MELRQLRYFRAVVEHGTFSAAAQALHLTQPSLSMAVRQLEQEMKADLLVRGPKGVRATEAGEILLRMARSIDEQVDHVTDEITAMVQGRSGRVRLAMTVEYVWKGLPQLLQRCWDEAPGLDISISHPAAREIITSIYSGVVDIAFILSADPLDLEVHHADNVETWRVGDLDLVAAVPAADYPDHESIAPADLSAKHWLVPMTDSWFRALPEVLTREWAEKPEAKPTKITEVSLIQTGLSMIGAGLGVALVPDTTDQILAPGVKLLPLDPPLPAMTLLAIWDATKPLSGPASRVLDAIKELWPNGAGENAG